MAKNQKIYTSDFYCTYCGQKGLPIVRKTGQDREAGHLKKLYCFICNKETNHAEVRPFGNYTKEDFETEFSLGRFVDGQKFPIAELLGCSKGDCLYNINGKCWNSDKSFNCGHRIIEE